ncbi:hypothetical protein SAMN02799622_03536 [Methylobacterium sp. UNC378MF]|uniref:hypothetical protein n=1 Tax=Methylobacterium sp. UNC378MF TaxID=1502748 RepID=UPI00088F4311|nr:hypothetical protein [Methylobacterium sp. UNC378MF]SDA25024.1 hypothetical protein SAMN02799622_03536 [Methylobacterium sp. UNC378MF]
MTRTEIEDGAAWACRVLRKPEPAIAERKPTQAERIAAWSARNREAESTATQTRSAVEQTRRDLHVPGSAFTVGAERYAADGSRWQRVA